MAKADKYVLITTNIPAVDIAAIDRLAEMYEVTRAVIIRRAVSRGLLKLIEAEPELAAQYREARARSQNMKRKDLRYDPSILERDHATA